MGTPEKENQEGRKNLSPEILRILDNSRLGYQEMQAGQIITIYAEDALTKKESSFSLIVLSTLSPKEDSEENIIFQYAEGDFNFYRGDNLQKTLKIKPGSLLGGGVSANFIPKPNLTMVYTGGIEVGARDHSFENINGEDDFAIAHRITKIEVQKAEPNFKTPDLREYLRKIELIKSEKEKSSQDINKGVEKFIEKYFKENPYYNDIEKLLDGFCPEGKIVIASFLKYAQEDDVFDKAWSVLEKYNIEHWQYDHPDIRGNLDLKESNRMVYEKMLKEAGIKWPRSGREMKAQEEDEISKIVLPKNKELREKLERKLKEYEVRLKNADRERTRIGAQNKIAVLKELLDNGIVEASVLKKRIIQEEWFDEDRFENAMWVINDYCETGGENVVGGTGLN